MPATPDLHLEGHLVATTEVVDTYRQDRDERHQLFLFRADEGYSLMTFARRETYGDSGRLAGGVLDVFVDHAGDVRQLEELVTRRWLLHSEAWWQLLDTGHQHDDNLHVCWAPERLRRDLDRASLYDRRLAVTTRFIGGEPLPALGRAEDGWQQVALDAMAEHLEELGWRVDPERLAVADSAEPGGIFSEATEIVGALRARRYGWEAAVLVRVDDCGEVYPRLAEPGDVTDAHLRMVDGLD
ncbi:MAG: hypothetical protein ACRDPR_09240, partial [Nocardioidaceae bacterium]